MRSTILSIISIGGLCNRMRSMAGAIKLAEEWNSNLIFVWVSMSDMNSSFSSLFGKFPYKVFDVKASKSLFRVLSLIKKVWHGIVIDDALVYQYFKKEDRGEKYLDGIVGRNILLWTCENITDAKDFSMFSPSQKVLDLLDKRIDRNTVGVHIRRTDSANSIKFSPTSLFIEKMQEEIDTNPDTQFYLATDDKEEESILKKHFGEKIIIYEKRSLDRNNPEGIIDAMVDLINLSHCHHLLGSYYSSFSEIAADWGKIERIVVKEYMYGAKNCVY